MIVTSIRIGATLKGDDGSFRKTEIEASPSEGQTAEQLLSEVKGLVESTSKGVAPTNGKKETPASPLAGKGSIKSQLQSQVATPKEESPPFEPGKDVAAEPKKRGRKPKTDKPAVDVKKLLADAKDSKDRAQLLERFNALREAVPADFDPEKYGVTLDGLRKVYASFNGFQSDQAVDDQLLAAFKAEDQRYANRRKEIAQKVINDSTGVA